VAMFERHGFERRRQIGKHHWVVSRPVNSDFGAASSQVGGPGGVS
jgi:hypothetical protein